MGGPEQSTPQHSSRTFSQLRSGDSAAPLSRWRPPWVSFPAQQTLAVSRHISYFREAAKTAAVVLPTDIVYACSSPSQNASSPQIRKATDAFKLYAGLLKLLVQKK